MLAIAAFSLSASAALAQSCPPDCAIKGGGSKSTDCLVEFDGVTPVQPGSELVVCTDGDPSCDRDGQIDGSCGFDITACVNNADPSLPECGVSGVDRVRVRATGRAGRDLDAALQDLLPTGQNVCTSPIRVDVPIFVREKSDLGDRHFSINPETSPFSLNGSEIQGANFTGSIDLHAGTPDPQTGIATVDVTGASEYVSAPVLGMAALCIKPVVPTANAGIIACGTRGARRFRVTAVSGTSVDRDRFVLACRPNVMFNTGISQNHDIGVVGVGDFTAEQCTAAGGHVEAPDAKHPNVCNGPFEIFPVEGLATGPGEMILADLQQIGLSTKGLPVEITLENALPCGDEPSASGMSIAIPLTTGRSVGRIENLNDFPGEQIETELDGEAFSCAHFGEEDGPGVAVLSAPQLDLPFVNDVVTGFKFSDR